MHGQVSGVQCKYWTQRENKWAKTAQHHSWRCVCYHLSNEKCARTQTRFDKNTSLSRQRLNVQCRCCIKSPDVFYNRFNLLDKANDNQYSQYQTKEQKKLHSHKLSFPKRSEDYWLISNQTQSSAAHLPQNWQIGGKLFLPYSWRWNIKLKFDGKVWLIFLVWYWWWNIGKSLHSLYSDGYDMVKLL